MFTKTKTIGITDTF